MTILLPQSTITIIYPHGANSSWSSSKKSDTQPVDEMFALVEDFINTKGLPVIPGEWGNTEYLPLKDRIDQATCIISKAKKLGVPAFWWESTIIPILKVTGGVCTAMKCT